MNIPPPPHHDMTAGILVVAGTLVVPVHRRSSDTGATT
jgi:hypothetical protein